MKKIEETGDPDVDGMRSEYSFDPEQVDLRPNRFVDPARRQEALRRRRESREAVSPVAVRAN